MDRWLVNISDPGYTFAMAVAVDVASSLKPLYTILVDPPVTLWNTFAGFLNRRLEMVMLFEAPVI